MIKEYKIICQGYGHCADIVVKMSVSNVFFLIHYFWGQICQQFSFGQKKIIYEKGTVKYFQMYIFFGCKHIWLNFEKFIYRLLGLQLESVIERLLASAFGTDLNAKIVNCLLAYRYYHLLECTYIGRVCFMVFF